MSLFDDKGNNIFFDKDDDVHLSEIAYSFIAGQLKHARALSALVAPTVNSYKRLVPGYEAPVYVGWAQINRSALIRIPRYTAGQDKATRAELRCPDPACNPYLAFAGMLVAGQDGMDNKLKPPKPLNNINIYKLSEEERKAKGIKELPSSLSEALSELDNDDVLKNALGGEIYTAFRRAKLKECEDYRIHVTDWEVEKYLESA
jgi:glutamine synthetase